MPWEYLIYPMVVNTISILHNISIPVKQENEDKDE